MILPVHQNRVSGLFSGSKQYGVILSTEVYILDQIRIRSLTAWLQVMHCYIYNVVKQSWYGYDGVIYIYIYVHGMG